MSDKAIYSVDTITSTKDDDKIYVNTGDNIKQVKKSDLLSELNSNLPKIQMYKDTGSSSNHVIRNKTSNDMKVFIAYKKSNNSISDNEYVYFKNDTSSDWLHASNVAGNIECGVIIVPSGSTLMFNVQTDTICEFAFIIAK